MPANSVRRLLLLIAAGVAAASLLTVVLGHRARGSPATTYSDLITRVERQPSSVSNITFKPGSRAIDATLSNGRAADTFASRLNNDSAAFKRPRPKARPDLLRLPRHRQGRPPLDRV